MRTAEIFGIKQILFLFHIALTAVIVLNIHGVKIQKFCKTTEEQEVHAKVLVVVHLLAREVKSSTRKVQKWIAGLVQCLTTPHTLLLVRIKTECQNRRIFYSFLYGNMH